MARSSNGLGQHPFTVEMHGSNPARATTVYRVPGAILLTLTRCISDMLKRRYLDISR